MDNYAIADNFSLLAKLMDIHGENSFKTKTYSVAAFTIEKLSEQLAVLPQEKIFSIKDRYEKREWLVKNIKGLGFKESSHFLRNIGFFDYAIIDFHIVDILVDNKIIQKPKNLNKENYLTIEKKLEKLANKTNLSLGELDLYLWYMETGTVYK